MIVFSKLPFDIIKNMSLNYVFIPKFVTDRKKLEKLNGDFEVKIKQYRNLKLHCKLFAIAKTCIDNDILNHIPNKDNDIQEFTIELLKKKFKDDVYTLIYISKFKFLPLEEIFLPNGESIHQVSSISFEKMDNTEFQSFFEKCIEWWAFILGVTCEELNEDRS